MVEIWSLSTTAMEWEKKNNMIIQQVEVIKTIDWSHVSLKPGEEGILCQCGKAILFLTKDRVPHQIVTLQCPRCWRELTYG